MENYRYILRLNDVTYPTQPNLGQIGFSIGKREKLSHKEYAEFMGKLQIAVDDLAREYNPEESPADKAIRELGYSPSDPKEKHGHEPG